MQIEMTEREKRVRAWTREQSMGLTSTRRKLGFLPFCAAHVSTCRPREPTPLTALVDAALSTSGAGRPKTLGLSRKWFICVEGSPLVRLTLQSNVVSVTSNAVSHTFENSVE
jgi:hypothetical protein